MTYWKANREVSKQIIEAMKERNQLVKNAQKLCRKYGGSRVYLYRSFGVEHYDGFAFKDESKVDKKVFVRLKGTSDGWRPRARTELAEQLTSLRSCYISKIMKIIGMDMFSGAVVRTPGVVIANDVAYLSVPEDVTPKGCTRISDLAFERATTKGL